MTPGDERADDERADDDRADDDRPLDGLDPGGSALEPCRRCGESIPATASEGEDAGAGDAGDVADDDALRTCATCGARHHRACAQGGCAAPGCPAARPSHPRWTVEARRKGLFLLGPAQAIPAWQQGVALAIVFLYAAFPNDKEVLGPLLEGVMPLLQGGTAWLVAVGGLTLLLLPSVALSVLMLGWHARHRSALVDDHGVLFDHGPRWTGARLSWRRIAGFRVRADGVALIVLGRPWTRLWSPLVPLTPADTSRFVDALEARKIRRLD